LNFGLRLRLIERFLTLAVAGWHPISTDIRLSFRKLARLACQGFEFIGLAFLQDILNSA
jgi:hypothetical protein